MTYADARYALLNIGVGKTKVINGIAVTRWSAETWEVGTWGNLMRERGALTNALEQLGFTPEPRNDAAAMVAEYQSETGCDWSTALARCNCD